MLGELADFRFNLGDGKITDLLVLDHDQRRTRIPIEKITTIGKDYIIIERGAATAEAEAAGDASPFSNAAAVTAEPTAAEEEITAPPAIAAEPVPVSTAPVGRGRQRGRSAAAQATPSTSEETPEPVPAAEPEEAPNFQLGDVLAPAGVAAELPTVSESLPAEESQSYTLESPSGYLAAESAATGYLGNPAEPEPMLVEDAALESPATAEQSMATAVEDNFAVQASSVEAYSNSIGNGNGTPGNGTNLDSVFSVPAAQGPADDLMSHGAAEPEAFNGGELQISKFDQKKLDFLRGKLAHRDIKDPAGIILVAKDEVLDQPALVRIVQGGVLGEVFIEMTLKK
jgi:hypothetical protein